MFQYIELTSTFRDRNRDPNPSEFTIPLSQTGTRTFNNALDYVSNIAPIIPVFETFTTQIASIAVVSVQQLNTFTYKIVGTNLSEIKDAYNGMIVTISNGTESQTSTIASYQPISDAEGIFTTTTPITISTLVPPLTLTLDTIDSVTAADEITLSIPGSSTYVPYRTNYKGYILYNETLQESVSIISTNPTTRSVSAIDLPSNWLLTDVYSIRMKSPTLFGTGVAVGGVITLTADVDSNALSLTVGEYNRMFVKLVDLTGPTEIIGVIQTYNPLDITISQPVPNGMYMFEILLFSYDNLVPYSFDGTTNVHNDQCMQVELLNIIIPNIDLQSKYKTPIDIPFLYVEIKSGNGGVAPYKLNSNNPNANHAIFRAPVDDTSFKLESPFLRIDGDGMVQTLKFKVNESMYLRVYTPDGELLLKNIIDTSSPHLPNEFIQISAMFSVMKL